MQIRHPQSGALFWITPGGGLQAGESLASALRRELNEELGLTEFEIGPLLWQRQHSFDWDQRRICQREDYYLVHSQRFEPIISDPVEATLLQAFRWWRLAELAQTSERLTPLRLATIVQNYLLSGPPEILPELEILVDPPLIPRD